MVDDYSWESFLNADGCTLAEAAEACPDVNRREGKRIAEELRKWKEEQKEKEQHELAEEAQEQLAKSYCVVYSATKAGRSDIRYIMTLQDAQKWCSSENSHNLGARAWHDMYTTVYNMCFTAWSDRHNGVLDLSGMYDDGHIDEKLAEVGVHKLTKQEIRDLFKKLEIQVNI